MTKAIFYMIVGSAIATLIYGTLQHEQIRQSLKPTFAVNTPWGTAEIMTPWGKAQQTKNETTRPFVYKREEFKKEADIAATITARKVASEAKQAAAPPENKIYKCEANGKKTYQNKPCD